MTRLRRHCCPVCRWPRQTLANVLSVAVEGGFILRGQVGSVKLRQRTTNLNTLKKPEHVKRRNHHLHQEEARKSVYSSTQEILAAVTIDSDTECCED